MKTTDTKGTAIRGVIASGSCKPYLHVLSRSFSDTHFLFTSSLFLGGNYSCVVIDQGLKWDLADLK